MRRVGLITGAKRGIGRGIALAMAQSGCDLALVDLDDDLGPMEDLRKTGAKVDYARCDLSDLGQHGPAIDQLADKFGTFQILVNNAGIASPRRDLFDALTPVNFDLVMNINLRGTVFFTQKVLPHLRGHKAAIVNITSVSAAMTSPERLDYCLSKAGLSAFSQGLAVILAKQGVSVFEVRPGIIATGMTEGAKAKYDVAIAEGLVPQNRWGQPADIGAIVASLASGTFAFATGSIIHADGGLSLARL